MSTHSRTARVAGGFVTLEVVGYDPLNATAEDRQMVEALVAMFDDRDRRLAPHLEKNSSQEDGR